MTLFSPVRFTRAHLSGRSQWPYVKETWGCIAKPPVWLKLMLAALSKPGRLLRSVQHCPGVPRRGVRSSNHPLRRVLGNGSVAGAVTRTAGGSAPASLTALRGSSSRGVVTARKRRPTFQVTRVCAAQRLIYKLVEGKYSSLM